jgi:hypothetical protein
MSRILRRPMFRGGQVVDSRGTGITSGLMDGGRVGYQNGELVTGSEIVETQKFKPYLSLNNLNFSAGMPFPYEKATPLNSKDKTAVTGVVDETKETEVDTAKDLADIGDNLFGELDSTETVTLPSGETTQAVVTGKEASPKVKLNLGIIDREEYNKITERDKKLAVGGRDLEEDAKLSQAAYDANILEQAKINDLTTNNTEEPEISAKDAVEANKELFAELLGKSKARGQDISDMLLRFSAAEGDTVGEKFKQFTKLEAAAGKGRAEKIDETAAALAIKDYIGGRTAERQADIMKSKIDYEYGKRGELANVQMDDDVQTALFKIGKLGDVSPTSDAAIKYLIGMKKDTNQVFRADKVKMKDLSKPNKLKKLKTGYNIIEEEGVKNIVLYDGKGDPNTVQVFSISELWNS